MVLNEKLTAQNNMEKQCKCGCTWECVESEEETTAELIGCPMCFVSEEVEEEPLKPIKSQKKPKAKKEKKCSAPRKIKKYTDEIVNRVREVVDEMTNPEIRDLLQREFDINVSVMCVSNMMSMKGIKRKKIEKIKEPIKLIDPHQKEIDELANRKRKGMSSEAVKIIEDNYMEKTDDELRELIADKTGAFFETDRIENYRESNGMARPVGWSPDDFREDKI